MSALSTLLTRLEEIVADVEYPELYTNMHHWLNCVAVTLSNKAEIQYALMSIAATTAFTEGQLDFILADYSTVAIQHDLGPLYRDLLLRNIFVTSDDVTSDDLRADIIKHPWVTMGDVIDYLSVCHVLHTDVLSDVHHEVLLNQAYLTEHFRNGEVAVSTDQIRFALGILDIGFGDISEAIDAWNAYVNTMVTDIVPLVTEAIVEREWPALPLESDQKFRMMLGAHLFLHKGNFDDVFDTYPPAP